MAQSRFLCVSVGVFYAVIGVLQPLKAKGFLEEPIEQRILTPVDPSLFAPGLCPNPTGTTDQGELLSSLRSRILVRPAPTDAERRESFRRHHLAMVAANFVYSLSDLEESSSGRQFVAQLDSFFGSIPEAYELYSFVSEADSGMKYAILAPRVESPKGAPWILAIAGTQSMLDWASNLDLGRAQLQKLSRLASLLTSCQFLDRNRAPLASHEWIVTGHSLGGGLAQAFAYQIAKTRAASRLNPVKMELVTFNAFGSRDLIEKDAVYVPWIVALMKVANYFVKGDPVSQIGDHIGPTFELTPLGEDPRRPLLFLSPRELVRRHSMSTVLAVVSEKGGPRALETALRQSPPVVKGLNQLVSFGSWLRDLPGFLARMTERAKIRVLIEATDDLLAVDKEEKIMTPTLVFTERLLYSRLLRLEERGQGLSADAITIKEALSRIQGVRAALGHR